MGAALALPAYIIGGLVVLFGIGALLWEVLLSSYAGVRNRLPGARCVCGQVHDEPVEPTDSCAECGHEHEKHARYTSIGVPGYGAPGCSFRQREEVGAGTGRITMRWVGCKCKDFVT